MSDTTTEQQEPTQWMDYKQYLAEKAWLAQAEVQYLRDNGLGWLVDFCSKPADDSTIMKSKLP